MTHTRGFDVVVIGAGPAGALAARSLAKRNRSVLLLERQRFPRQKVCGCCLNASALQTLEREGMGGLGERLGAEPTSRLTMWHRGRSASLNLPGGVSVSRAALDTALVREAKASGVTFRDGVSAKVMALGKDANEGHTVRLSDGHTIQGRTVIAADGLSGTCLSGVKGFDTRVRTDGRLGMGAIIETTVEEEGVVPAGHIVMACGCEGYVGAVRLEDGRIDLAAAVDALALKQAGGPAALAQRIVDSAGITINMPDAWCVTPRLTRSRVRRGGMGLFVVGDAAGYVEPFTGEGMAWAMAGGVAVASFVDQAVDRWEAEQAAGWEAAYRRVIRKRQWSCHVVAATLRRPWATGLAVRTLSMWPSAAQPLLRSIAQPSVISAREASRWGPSRAEVKGNYS